MRILIFPVLAVLAACTTPEGAVTRDAVFDPFEQRNREVFNANTELDRLIIGGGASAYGGSVPAPVRRMVGNLADNLDGPGAVVNNVLQGNGEDAIHNGFRFVLNTTLGVGGLFDVASSFGLEERDADFGQTLAVWGAPEGAYLVLPVLGPSTERDAIGKVVDRFLDPLGFAFGERERYYALGVKVAAKVGKRDDFGDTVDDLLYDSADSYAQARILYLQNRRFDVAGGTADDEYFDPYED
ncbi:VacJ family lipoprotein [Oceaniglobus ichthyenteri]|uniref:MlaA family lipoprotein n=1 Tax=Oceaniglobus ichthyenteri TaxID=2136177 RepID=UPI000D3B266E|nr:VacJ family lipoprotein [Oceaniglobus ichthyenteri]